MVLLGLVGCGGSNNYRGITSLNKAIMEEEAESGGNSDESLLKFFGNFGADNVFDIGANIGVEVLSELGECWGRKEEGRKKREYNKEIEATHFRKLIKFGEGKLVPWPRTSEEDNVEIDREREREWQM